jgi:hypothetical protein
VVIRPGGKRGQVHAELYGELPSILELTSAKSKPRTSGDVRGSLVAGARNHLYRTWLYWNRSEVA